MSTDFFNFSNRKKDKKNNDCGCVRSFFCRIICRLCGCCKCCEGSPGPEGPQGPQGIQGPKGEKGCQGPQGPQGEKGDSGDIRPQGAKGDKGDTGAQGAKGDKGDTGAQGPKGDKGDKGDTGAQGAKGDKGDTGAQGPKGDKGDTGAQGPPGTCNVVEACSVNPMKDFLRTLQSIQQTIGLEISSISITQMRLNQYTTIDSFVMDAPNDFLVKFTNPAMDVEPMVVPICEICAIQLRRPFEVLLPSPPVPDELTGPCKYIERPLRLYFDSYASTDKEFYVRTEDGQLNPTVEGMKVIGTGLGMVNFENLTYVSLCRINNITEDRNSDA